MLFIIIYRGFNIFGKILKFLGWKGVDNEWWILYENVILYVLKYVDL